MVRYAYLICLALLMAACAEVGTISGGPEDQYAPQLIDARCSPQNGSVNFQGQVIELTFDEFFKLNDPGNNIRMVPPHAQLIPTMKGKSLALRWEEQLEPNTTYAVYLNNAVSDITEQNDSILQFVFSTGPLLDTLSYEIALADAWSGDPVKGCTVGLYDLEKGEIQSIAETDRRGMARLNYLREGSYRLLAFVDKNKDLTLQADESLAFPLTSEVRVDSAFVFDSIPLRLFTPKGEAKIRTERTEFPGLFTLAAQDGLSGAEVFVEGEKLDVSSMHWLDRDSLLIPIDLVDKDFIDVVVHSELITDTLRIRANKNDRARRVSLRTLRSSTVYSPADSLVLWCTDWIESVDTSKMTFLDGKDSSRLDFSLRVQYNTLAIDVPDRDALEKVLVNFQPGAVIGRHGESTATVFQFAFQSARKYGSLLVDLSGYRESVLVHLVRSGKIVRNIPVNDPSALLKIEYLDPDEYSFIVVRDVNQNGRWDVGDYATGLQPEAVDRYSEKIKVRANWDVETALIPRITP